MKDKGLNRNQIKYLVIVAMLMDHIAWIFCPLISITGQILHMIGRLTAPVMAYFVAEGYRHTANVKRYALRLALFALFSWIPYVYYLYGTFPIIFHEHSIQILPYFSMIYTLLLGLLAIWFYDRCVCPQWCKGLGIAGFCLLSQLGDWSVFGVLLCLLFYVYRGQPRRMWLYYCGLGVVYVICCTGDSRLWQQNIYLCGFFLVPLLMQVCYTGRQGSRRPVHKWFFYWFYPAHLLVLGLVWQYWK